MIFDLLNCHKATYELNVLQRLNEDNLCISEFESCVFQVQAKQSYHHELQLDQHKARRGISAENELELNESEVKLFKNMTLAAKEERERNQQVVLLNAGRPLRFSDSFQLLHIKSKKFLKALFMNAADVEGNRVQILLSQTASYFRMKSVFAQKHAGEPVHDLEAVSILPEGLVGAALNYVSQFESVPWARGACDMYEVSVYGAGVSWLVQHYARDSLLARTPAAESESTLFTAGMALDDDCEGSRHAQLRCGQVVRLLHSHLNAYLAATPNLNVDTLEVSCALIILEPRADTALADTALLSYSSAVGPDAGRGRPARAAPSVYTLWLVENADASRGVPLHFGLAVRLRNVATGTYLTLRRPEGLVASSAALRPSEMPLSLFMFRRLPEQRGEDDAVCRRTVVWLAYCGDDRPAGYVRAQRRDGAAEPELLLSPDLLETDGLIVDAVDADCIADVNNAVSAREALVRFVRDARDDARLHDWAEARRVCDTIERLCVFLAHTSPEGARSAEPANAGPGLGLDMQHGRGFDSLKLRQALLRELNILDVLVCYVTSIAMWDEVLQGGLSGDADFASWYEMRTAGIKLLHLAIRQNSANGLHLIQYLQVMFDDLAKENSDPRYAERASVTDMSLCDVILAIYENNELALHTITNQTADLFLNALKTQRHLRPKYLQMLGAIMDYQGEELAHEKANTGICDKFLDHSRSGVFPETQKRGDVVLVKMPSMSRHGGYFREIKDVMSDPLDCEYYFQYVKLLSCFLHGRTRSVDENRKKLAGAGFFSFDLCFTCVKSEDLPPSIRAAYCRLLIDVFIDAPPQEAKQFCEDLQIWSEVYHQPLPKNELLDSSLDNLMGAKGFVLIFLETQGVQGQDAEMDLLTTSILELVENLLRFGFYNTTIRQIINSPEIKNYQQYKERLDAFSMGPAKERDGKVAEIIYEFELLVKPLMHILDPTTDQISSKRDSPSRLVQKTKICCCKIFDLMCDMVLILRLKMLLRVYEYDLVNGLVPHLDVSNEALNSGALRPEFENVMKLNCSLSKTALTISLSELLKFNDPDLDQYAMRLVLRLNGQRSFLLNRLYRTELLVNETVVHLYREHRTHVQSMDDLIITLVTIQRQKTEKKKQILEAERMKRLQSEIDKDETAAAKTEREESPVARGAAGLFKNVLDNIGSKLLSLRGQLKKDSSVMEPNAEKTDTSQAARNSHISFMWKHPKMKRFDRLASTKSLKIELYDDLCESDTDDDGSVLEQCVNGLKKSVQTILSDCPVNQDENALLSIQTQFRELKVHTKMVHILRALCHDENFPREEQLISLAKDCCLLCANFCFKNVKNSYLLYPHLDLFLHYLSDPIGLKVRANDVIYNMFNDNRLLCTQTSHLIENRIIAFIVSLGQRSPFLALLSALLCPRGVPIQQNQVRIAKSLHVHRDKVLSLFEGKLGLKQLKSLHVAYHEKRRMEALTKHTSPLHASGNQMSENLEIRMLDVLASNPATSRSDGSPRNGPVPDVEKDCEVLYFCQMIKLFAKLCTGIFSQLGNIEAFLIVSNKAVSRIQQSK